MFSWFRKIKKPKDPIIGGPYRINAAHIKGFKMNMPKLGKFTKTFSLILPVGAASVAGGMVHDMPIIGDGMKFGCYGALALLSAFFLMVAYATLSRGTPTDR